MLKKNFIYIWFISIGTKMYNKLLKISIHKSSTNKINENKNYSHIIGKGIVNEICRYVFSIYKIKYYIMESSFFYY